MKRSLLVAQIIVWVPLIWCAQAPKDGTTGSSNRPLTGIDLTKWKLHLEGVRVRGGLPAYFPLDDNAASAAVLEIAPEARAPEDVACLALVKNKRNPPMVFVGGAVDGPADSLISVGVELTNSDQKPVTFLVGDVTLVSPGGQKLRPIAVSGGDSPLVAKFSDNAWRTSGAVPVTVAAGKTVRLNYCLVIGPNSFPLRLQLGTAKTNTVLNDLQTLTERGSQDRGFSVSMAGQLTIDADVPSETFEASVGRGVAVLRFESVALKRGERLAASGGRSMDTLEGVDGPDAPLFEIFQGRGYVAGKLFVLQPITPIKAAVTVQGRPVTFANSFQARTGDVLGGTTSGLADDSIEWVLSQLVVIQPRKP
ncbi:MAG: hypothetical protein ACLQU1_24220 [Bryobacteraceae bacterium]